MLALLPRLIAVAALAVSAYVHLHLAPRYPYPGTVTGTQLFYAQGAVAIAAAVALLLVGNRWTWLFAIGVGVVSFAAVMVSRYGDIGAIGPLPDMRDATWQPSPDKLLSAVAEASVPLWWLLALALRVSDRPRPGRRPRPSRRRSDAPRPAGS